MKVLVSKLVFIIPYSSSLKDKRNIIRAIKDRVWSKFRASISEVEEQNSIQRAVLGLVYVSNDSKLLESLLSKIIDMLETSFPGLIHDYEYYVETH
ncbi:MAG: hypothetical protein AMS17_11410 [Spirochaetes bacterium DG_61]|nr:MAG: hypothetical protein AMS17_11410 [Spirochaetes bacterium DG_61]